MFRKENNLFKQKLKNKAAFDLVCRMAEAHSNGHENCLDIKAAVKQCREVFLNCLTTQYHLRLAHEDPKTD